MDLNFRGSESDKSMFYCQMKVTTFFGTYFLTLEYIMGMSRVQFADIFRKNVWGGKKGVFFPPRFQYSMVCSRRDVLE